MTDSAAACFPPFAALARVAADLESAGIVAGLGGSGLLSALGIATGARDWDLTTDAPLERVRARFADLAHEVTGPNGIHADHKLVLLDGTIEIIVGFSIRAESGVVRLPTLPTTPAGGVRLGSPEVWAAAYHLMGREAKADTLLAWLARRGAARAAVDHLLQEPIPAPLRARLEALPIAT